MRLLLDTHIFLWFITGDSHLPIPFFEAIIESENEVFLSAASVWEIIIKYDLGRLPLPDLPGTYIPTQRERHRIETLPITESSLKCLSSLSKLHSDPFDRCLISQALCNDLILVTIDQAIMKYDVPFLK